LRRPSLLDEIEAGLAVIQAAVDVRAAHVNEVRSTHYRGGARHDTHRHRRCLAPITTEHRAVRLAQSQRRRCYQHMMVLGERWLRLVVRIKPA
jgi:hypothetical protein